MIDWTTARAVAANVTPVGSMLTLEPAQALGSVLAEPLIAGTALPMFDQSAMDGFAVRGAGPWTVTGRTLAGQSAGPELADGQAREVATGAPVPPGAEAVVTVESAERVGDRLSAVVGPPHIRRVGEEAVAGDELVPRGTRVTPQVVALAASAAARLVTVRSGTSVAAIVTGDELISGQVHDALGPAIPGWVAWAGGTLVDVRQVGDGHVTLRDLIAGATADLVIVTGSSSVGPADHLAAVLTELRARSLVDRIACRPGGPTTLAQLPDQTFVLGLPGNPLAALAGFLTIGQPLLSALRGEQPAAPAQVSAPHLERRTGSTLLVPVRIEVDGVTEVGHGRAAMLRGAAVASHLAVVDPESAEFVKLLDLPR